MYTHTRVIHHCFSRILLFYLLGVAVLINFRTQFHAGSSMITPRYLHPTKVYLLLQFRISSCFFQSFSRFTLLQFCVRFSYPLQNPIIFPRSPWFFCLKPLSQGRVAWRSRRFFSAVPVGIPAEMTRFRL